MSKKPTKIDSLAEAFLSRAKEIYVLADPIKILKARAYQIGYANALVRIAFESNKRYFFGLNYITLEEISNFDNSFIVFICGSIDQTLIVPSQVIINNLSFISCDRNGEYKINVDKDLNVVLKGRGNRLDCSSYINNWDLFLKERKTASIHFRTPEESLHSILQGRLLEIGKIRGYETFCPDKSKEFNRRRLGEISTLQKCPELQFCDYDILRRIDVLWFRQRGDNFIPEYAFEIEISTGTWSGVGRMATLLDYANVKLYIISKDHNKYKKVMTVYPDLKPRYVYVSVDDVSELYSVEINLQELRKTINL